MRNARLPPDSAPFQGSLQEVDLNITNRCNLTCEYCSVSVTPVSDRTPELSLQKIEQLFAEFEELGVTLVRIVGGEPFIRRDIKEILRMAGHRSFRTVLLTNGTAVKHEHVDLISELPSIQSIDFSLDGVDAERHAHSRGCQSAFTRVVDMADYCTKRGVGHSMMTVVTAEAMAHMCELVEFAAQHGMQAIVFIMLGYAGEAVRSPHAFPPYRAWSTAIVALTHFLRNNRHMPSTRILFPHEDPVPLELFRPLEAAGLLDALQEIWGIRWRLHNGPVGEGKSWCLAGKNTVAILPNGDVFGCELMRHIPELLAGNVWESSLREVFEKSPILKRLRSGPVVHGRASFSGDSQTFSCGQCRAGDHNLRKLPVRADGQLVSEEDK